jgi:hypothetical protein
VAPLVSIADLPSTVNLNATSYFKVTQYPLPGTGICTNFWNTGSGAPSILLASTASDGLNQYVGSRQYSIDRSGFNPISLDFEPQPYDEIRFQGIENLAFGITNVTSSNGQLQLQLDGNIPNGTNLNYFLLRRYVDNPAYLILEVDKPAGDSGGGLLKPEFLLGRTNSSISQILLNLEESGLLLT